MKSRGFLQVLNNRWIFVIGLTFALSLIFMPFIPQIKFEIDKRFNFDMFRSEHYLEKYQVQSVSEGNTSIDSFRRKVDLSTNNRLIIPPIGVDIETYANEDQNTALNKGAWVVPGSALPGESGQMVITAHRFQFAPPAKNTFYNLDKLKTGDTFFLINDNYMYQYRVTNIEDLAPEEFEFLGTDSQANDVVLYTCTPLWTAARRLIVHSEPIPFSAS